MKLWYIKDKNQAHAQLEILEPGKWEFSIAEGPDYVSVFLTHEDIVRLRDVLNEEVIR